MRKHLAAERSASHDKKLPIVFEKAGIPGDSIDGVHEYGGHFLRENPKKSAKSLGLDDREIDSSRGNCPRYREGFCIGFHTSMGGRRGEGSERAMPSFDRGTKADATSKNSLLGGILRDYEKVYPTIRKKRSSRARCNGDLSGKNGISDVYTLSPLLLSGGIHKVEMDAAISLLTISEGIMNRDFSAGNEILKESSSLDEIENVAGISDGFNLEVSNKRRRVFEFDDVGFKLPELPDCIGNFSTFTNFGRKSVEHEVILHVMSGGVEVRSSKKSNGVAEMKFTAVDVLEGERLPSLIADNEVGGDGRKIKLSDSGCRKIELVYKRMGYKCKNCGNIFPTQQALGCHRAEYRNRTNCSSSLNSEKNKNVTVNVYVSSPSPADQMIQTLSPYEAGLKEQNFSVAARDKVCTLGPALSNGQKRCPCSKGSAAGVSKTRSCYGTVSLHANALMEMLGKYRNVRYFEFFPCPLSAELKV